MTSVFLLGAVCTLLIEGMAWIGVRAWRQTYGRRPEQVQQSQAQVYNEAFYQDLVAHHPQVRSMPLQRRVRRGRPLPEVETSDWFQE